MWVAGSRSGLLATGRAFVQCTHRSPFRWGPGMGRQTSVMPSGRHGYMYQACPSARWDAGQRSLVTVVDAGITHSPATLGRGISAQASQLVGTRAAGEYRGTCGRAEVGGRRGPGALRVRACPWSRAGHDGQVTPRPLAINLQGSLLVGGVDGSGRLLPPSVHTGASALRFPSSTRRLWTPW